MKLLRTLRTRIRAKHLWTALAMLGVILLPAIALAIPGAGDFTSLESPTGRSMTGLYNLLAKICMVIFVIVCAVMFGAILRFRRKSDDERPEQVHGNMKVEFGLLVAASIVQIFIGIKTIDVMWYVEKIPAKTDFTVEAIGYQWDWKFRYPDHGGMVTEDLVIPAYTNVRLEITSEDVIHSLFVPELGIKMDAVPGRLNYWWINADGPVNQLGAENRLSPETARRDTLPTTRPDSPMLEQVLNQLNFVAEDEKVTQYGGLEQRVTYLSASRKADDRYAKYDAVEYRGMCTEICGKGHYDMYFRVVAMTPDSFKQWVEDQKNGGGRAADGGAIYSSKCASCHGADGAGIGAQFPPLAGSEWVNQDNDENKRKHIEVVLNGLKGEIKVKGQTYNGVMQPWFSVFNDEEVAAVVNHERTNWGNAGGEVTPKMVAEVREGLGHLFYLAGGATPVVEKDLQDRGAQIYEACSTCHGADGKKLKPALATSSMVVSNIEGFVGMLVNGTTKKSAMGRSMSDEEIASIITYTRMSLGANASAVQPSEVKRIREQVEKPLK